MPYKDESVRKSKHKEYSHSHYLKNKEATKLRTKQKNIKNKEEWDLFKGTLKCTKCGFNHPAALDFHHENPAEKEYAISKLISNKRFKTAVEEVKKCIVLCANCHRIHHYKEKPRLMSGVSV